MSVRINLLPIRAARRASTAKQELYIAAGVIAATLIGVYIWNASVSSKISTVREEIAAVERELDSLEQDRIRVDEFIKKNKSLEGKRDAIAQLQKQRVGPAKLLDDLATILTAEKKVWLTELIERDGEMTLKGGAMENVNISDFQLSLKRNSPYFKSIQLVEINQVESKEPPKVEYLEWTITCTADYAAGS